MNWRHKEELMLLGKILVAVIVALLPCIAYPFNRDIAGILAFFWFNLIYTAGNKRIAKALNIDERFAGIVRFGACAIALFILIGSFLPPHIKSIEWNVNGTGK